MIVLEGLLVFALLVVAWWLLGAVAEARGMGGRRNQPPVRAVVPPPLPRPPGWGHADQRHTRPGPPGTGRHRAPDRSGGAS
ncbi:hypothetical protein ACWEQC_32635 [Streptomyces shenzhenensis]